MKWLSRLGRRFTSARALCVALLFALMFLRVTDPAPARGNSPPDLRYLPGHRTPRSHARPVVIVDIDEQSLQKLGQWPWPRTRIADMITELTRLGAVGDRVRRRVLRAGPAQSRRCGRHLRNLDEETRDKLRALPSNDQDHCRCDPAVARGARRVRPARRSAELDATLPVDRTGDAGRGAAALHVRIPGAVAQRPDAGECRRRARPVHASSPSATASSGACR